MPGEGVVAKIKHSCREQRRRNSTTSISRTCLLLKTAAKAGGKMFTDALQNKFSPLGFLPRVSEKSD